ncbi:unnamed protein product [Klebsiella pneumoniae subsp. rhinoscleromatis SB3432]|nr:unnamed protein product [Klebsiella pneumoniae subsp. rhinoscleromatis SB3432]
MGAIMVPKRLEEARLRAKLTQEHLIELRRVDIVQDKSQISNYETGKFYPPFHFIVNVAKALNYPEAYFYTLDDDFAELLLNIHRNKRNADVNYYTKPVKDARKLVNELKQLLDNAAGMKR